MISHLYPASILLLGSSAALAAGTGLQGQYFDNIDFTALKTTRTDANINFSFPSTTNGGKPSGTAISNGDTFSIRWTGVIRPTVGGSYIFYTKSDDGVRLYVNNKLVINNWTNHAVVENKSSAIALTANQDVAIKLEYYDNAASGSVSLSWSGPSNAKQIIPSSVLYPSGNVGTQPTPRPSSTPAPTPASTPAPTAGPVSASLGLHYNKEVLAIWKSRIAAGPYNKKGNGFTNSPGDWERILANAQSFLSNPDAQLWKPTATLGAVAPTQAGIKARDAAFVYLLTGDARMGNAARDFLLKQIDVPHADIGDWTEQALAKFRDSNNPTYIKVQDYLGETGWFESEWLTRMLFLYDYTKDLFTSAQKTDLNNFFRRAGWTHAHHVDGYVAKHFPNRLKGDYNTRVGHASSGALRGEYTHADEKGVMRNNMSRLSSVFNNRRASEFMTFAMVGFFLNDAELQRHAKIYAKEWIIYSMYADGAVGEFQRNGDYGHNQEGLVYNSINAQAYAMVADQFARRGDFELFNFVTSSGLHGTQGGSKGLKMNIELYYKLITGATKWSWPKKAGACQVLNLVNECGTSRVVYVQDLYFAPLANQYYKSQYIRDGYKRLLANSIKYPSTGIAFGPMGAPYGGVGAVFPGVLFMFGDMEGKAAIYPGK